MSNFKLLIFIILCSSQAYFGLNHKVPDYESWTGRWFPYKPTEPSYSSNNHFWSQSSKKIPMGENNPNCDDGKTNLTLDWSGSFLDYVCLNPRGRFVPDKSIDSVMKFQNIPKAYHSPHFCMDQKIQYDSDLPTFGPHRPLWPVYGEYLYLPKQRWLHTLEHGGIVALHHPCADLKEIFLLKSLVKSCLRRYVISPEKSLPKERPLALLAWGVSYTMSSIYPNAVRQFIRERALKGPERIAADGQYDANLLRNSSVVSDFEDSELCPEQ